MNDWRDFKDDELVLVKETINIDEAISRLYFRYNCEEKIGRRSRKYP